MRRRIKFRGRCAGDWRMGDHLTYYGGEVIKHWSGSLSFEYDVEPDTVGQFTGAYDCDGKEIYEGDILQFKDIPSDCFEVFYYDKFCAFAVKNPVQALRKDETSHFKVIGNIHDNPELLKGE